MDTPSIETVMVWTDASAAPTLRQVFNLMGSWIEPIGVGGPRRGEVDELADELGCPREDDFRRLLVDWPARFVLLATMSGVEQDDLAVAIKARSSVLTLEPPFGDLTECRATRPAKGSNATSGSIAFVPAFDRCVGWSRAADPMQVLGAARLVGFTSWGSRPGPSLFARLHDAWKMALRFGPLPEGISASLISTTEQMPDNLRSVSGHMALQARLGGVYGPGVVIDVSDHAGAAGRQLRLVGADGQIWVNDDSYAVYTSEGQLLDGNLSNPLTADATYPQLIAEHWRRLVEINRQDLELPVSDDEMITACCQASLLSARTGQAESPKKLLIAHGYAKAGGHTT